MEHPYEALLARLKNPEPVYLKRTCVATAIVGAAMGLCLYLVSKEYTSTNEIPELESIPPDSLCVFAFWLVLEHGFYGVHYATLKGSQAKGRALYSIVRFLDNFIFPPLYVSVLLSLNKKMELSLKRALYLPDYVRYNFCILHHKLCVLSSLCYCFSWIAWRILGSRFCYLDFQRKPKGHTRSTYLQVLLE